MNRRTKNDTSTGVAVALRKQPILPLCLLVIEECKQTGLESIRLEYAKNITDTTPSLWIDAVFLMEALNGLIKDAVRYSNNDDPIILAVQESMNLCRVSISFKPSQTNASDFNEPWESLHFGNSRTREIVSQHGAKFSSQIVHTMANIAISFGR